MVTRMRLKVRCIRTLPVFLHLLTSLTWLWKRWSLTSTQNHAVSIKFGDLLFPLKFFLSVSFSSVKFWALVSLANFRPNPAEFMDLRESISEAICPFHVELLWDATTSQFTAARRSLCDKTCLVTRHRDDRKVGSVSSTAWQTFVNCHTGCASIHVWYKDFI
jgi:hypothetical protein